MTSILNDTTPRLTRHLSDHHAVQGEAEYVERHAPVTDLCASGQARALDWTPGVYTTRDDDGGKREGFPRRLFAWMAENYLIIQQDSPDGLFLLRGKSDGTGLAVPTLEAAKAAAQADYERRILAALTSSPGWQPIETAPRDGTVFLALEDGEYYGCARSECGDCWVGYCGQPVVYTLEPTHWMPLPAAPEVEGGSDDL